MMKSAALSSLLLFSGAKGSSGWDYSQAGLDWAHVSPFCGLPDQSPIDIQPDKGKVNYDSSVCQPRLNWTIDLSANDWMVWNSGHSLNVQAIRKLPSDTTSAGDLTDSAGNKYEVRKEPIASFPNYFRPEGSPIERWCLDGFHFHWGLEDDEGSEHLLNSKAYPIEVHFVHYACDRGSVGGAVTPFLHLQNISDARAAGEDFHTLAVIGIFFELSEIDNPIFESILSEDMLDKVQFPSGTDRFVAERGVFLQNIIPEKLFTEGYWAYEGSLTTPGCYNLVRWHVSNQFSTISKRQLSRFRELMSDGNHTQAPNFRAPQNNVNPVYACMNPPPAAGRDELTVSIVWIYSVVILLVMFLFAGCCYMQSVRAKRIAALAAMDASNTASDPEHLKKRQRLASKSSIDRRSIDRRSSEAH